MPTGAENLCASTAGGSRPTPIVVVSPVALMDDQVLSLPREFHLWLCTRERLGHCKGGRQTARDAKLLCESGTHEGQAFSSMAENPTAVLFAVDEAIAFLPGA